MNDERQSILASVGYAAIYPARCCRNCAYFSGGHCARLVGDMNSNGWSRFTVETCGLCRKWLSPTMVILALECSSIEELEVRKQVQFGEEELKAMDLTELNDWFSVRKATPKMLRLRDAIVNSAHPMYGKCCKGISDPPIAPAREEASAETGLIRRCRLTDAFWPVHVWIKQNKPVWDDWMEKRKTKPGLGAFSFAGLDPRENSIFSQVLAGMKAKGAHFTAAIE